MIVTKPPHLIGSSTTKVFLAGSIEMGSAPDWQRTIAEAVADEDVEVLNPRRDDWDASWTQSIDNPQFKQQVTWELDGIDAAAIVCFYFSPGTQSPITLLELGIVSSSKPQSAVVCCPDGFWRKGNVDVVCARAGITQVADLSSLATELRRRIAAYKPT